MALLPQFFGDTYRCRNVFEETLVAKPIEGLFASVKSSIHQKHINAALKNYQLQNKQVHRWKNLFAVNDLVIFTAKALAARNQQTPIGETRGHSFPDMIHLSKMGFDSKQLNAVFYIELSSSAYTSYFVWMQKISNQWRIEQVEQTGMIIY